MMPLASKKLGVLISARPDEPNFSRAIQLVETALKARVDVYVYCIDEAVPGVDDPRLAELKAAGLKLFACAYGAQQRNLKRIDQAIFAGLAALNELIVSTDRFVSFN